MLSQYTIERGTNYVKYKNTYNIKKYIQNLLYIEEVHCDN